jgi:hypothetical protein
MVLEFIENFYLFPQTFAETFVVEKFLRTLASKTAAVRP